MIWAKFIEMKPAAICWFCPWCPGQQLQQDACDRGLLMTDIGLMYIRKLCWKSAEKIWRRLHSLRLWDSFPTREWRRKRYGRCGWRPPYQSKIWYGDAIPIKSKAANLFIICNKSRIKTSAFYMFLSDEFWAVTQVAKIQSTRTGLE